MSRGERLPELRIGPIGADWVARYAAASLDANPIHTDPDAAAAVGLPGPVVHGMLFVGQFESLLARWRPDWRVTKLDAKFLRPVPLGEEVLLTGRLMRSEGAGQSVAVRLTVRMKSGGLACVGDVRLESPGAG
jgi:acyl dehydratase